MNNSAIAARAQDTQIARLVGWTVQIRHDQVTGRAFTALCDPGGNARRLYNESVFAGDQIEAWQDVPHYSTDRSAAFTILDRLRAQGWDYELLNDGDVIYCVLCKDVDDPYGGDGETEAAAICRAALAALGAVEEQQANVHE